MVTDLQTLIITRKKKEANRPVEITEEKRVENIKHWTTFYRRNINLYIEDRLGVRLDPDQHLMAQLINESMTFVGIASRGAAKSFMLGTVGISFAMLYPKSEIVLVASTIPQGMVIFNKIRNELCGGSSKKGLSPLLSYLAKKDLIHFRTSDIALEIDLGKLNGSKLTVLPPLDSSRGARSTFTIYDEFRLLKKGDVDSIFEPMGHRRQSEFLNLPEYKGRTEMMEEAKSCYISSSGWKSEWIWNLAKSTITDMLNNSSVPTNLFAEDVYIPMKYGRITHSQYTKLKSNMTSLTFRMEMLNECLGEADDAYFKLDEFRANQVIRHGLRAPNTYEYISHANLGNREKKHNEYRIMCVDFAFEKTVRTQANDNTVIQILCCFWKDGKLIRNNEYIETLEGGGDPVTRIKELYYDFDVDYIVYDSKNGGDVYSYQMTQNFIHPERGVEFKGFTSAPDDDLQVANIAKVRALEDKTVDPTAIKCLIPVTATEDFNSLIWTDLKLQMQKGNIRFLITELEFDEDRLKDKKWLKMTSEERMRTKLPFAQTSLLCEEMINLTATYSGGKVKLKEPRSGFKDRAVSLAYGNYVATLLENKLQRETNDINYDVSQWTLVV